MTAGCGRRATKEECRNIQHSSSVLLLVQRQNSTAPGGVYRTAGETPATPYSSAESLATGAQAHTLAPTVIPLTVAVLTETSLPKRGREARLHFDHEHLSSSTRKKAACRLEKAKGKLIAAAASRPDWLDRREVTYSELRTEGSM